MFNRNTMRLTILQISFFVLQFFFFTDFTSAQNVVTIHGTTVEDSTFAPVSFASIYLAETRQGTISEVDGRFSLGVDTAIHGVSMRVSAIGYETRIIPLDSFVLAGDKGIRLRKTTYNLPVVPIVGMSAKNIVKTAIAMLPANYGADTFYLKAFYRQYHYDGLRYVRLIEANVMIENRVAKNAKSLKGKERVSVLQLRRSDNNEQNKEEHGDHLMDLLEENPVLHPVGTVLNIKSIDSYKFFPDTNEAADVPLWHIFYFSTDLAAEHLEKGELFIDKKSFAVVMFTKEERKNNRIRDKRIYPSTAPYRWDFWNGKMQAEYELHDGKYFLKTLDKTYMHDLYDNTVNYLAWHITECFELRTDSVFSKEKIIADKNFSVFSNLYHRHYAYDKNFWDNYALRGFVYAKENDVLRDLGKQRKPEEQFVENGSRR